MKTYKRNGKFVFLPGHRLEVEQVRSLFGRFFREVKSQQSEGSIADITENIATDIDEGNGICSLEDADTYDAAEEASACFGVFEALKTDAVPNQNCSIKVRYFLPFDTYEAKYFSLKRNWKQTTLAGLEIGEIDDYKNNM